MYNKISINDEKIIMYFWNIINACFSLSYEW